MIGEMPILIPGIGTQGGDARKAFELGKNSRGVGVIVAAARSIIFASGGPDFAVAARGAAKLLTTEYL
jgi:orotidine-5'-phosphate decarboxylase